MPGLVITDGGDGDSVEPVNIESFKGILTLP